MQTISTEAASSTQQGIAGKSKKHGKISLFSKLLANLTHKNKGGIKKPASKKGLSAVSTEPLIKHTLLKHKQDSQPSITSPKSKTDTKEKVSLIPTTKKKNKGNNAAMVAAAQETPLLKHHVTETTPSSHQEKQLLTSKQTGKTASELPASISHTTDHHGLSQVKTHTNTPSNIAMPTHIKTKKVALHQEPKMQHAQPPSEATIQTQIQAQTQVKSGLKPVEQVNASDKSVQTPQQQRTTKQTINLEQTYTQAQTKSDLKLIEQANPSHKQPQAPLRQSATQQPHELKTHMHKPLRYEQVQTLRPQSDIISSAQPYEQSKQQPNPGFTTSAKIQPSTFEPDTPMVSQTSTGVKNVDASHASSQHDFLSSQQDTNPAILDMSKVDNKSRNTDFQAQLAYKTQQSYTPHDAVLEIVKSAKHGSTTLELQLEPAHLGKVQVHIQTDATKQLQVLFTVEHHASRQALEQHMPQLRLAMAQQGLDLGSFSMQMHQQQTQQQEHGQQQTPTGYTPTDQTDAQGFTTQQTIGVNIANDGRLSILA